MQSSAYRGEELDIIIARSTGNVRRAAGAAGTGNIRRAAGTAGSGNAGRTAGARHDKLQSVPPVRRRLSPQEARARRKRIVRRQRIATGLWMLCILVISAVLLTKGDESAAAENGKSSGINMSLEDQKVQFSNLGGEGAVQGLPKQVYAAHPDWTEDFLTPNEYSRPGDALTEVKNIFVHYTANPGTSAAQNRSYFEQQKDLHEASVSAHFIIGYEGEIIQCLPLDEIGYAVQSRNFDSISIECCYKAKDGSFTQETYDSLIKLLVWLTDAYELEPEDILRHYDCGGKKCPLYYTENPDEWEKLLEDVESDI